MQASSEPRQPAHLTMGNGRRRCARRDRVQTDRRPNAARGQKSPRGFMSYQNFVGEANASRAHSCGVGQCSCERWWLCRQRAVFAPAMWRRAAGLLSKPLLWSRAAHEGHTCTLGNATETQCVRFHVAPSAGFRRQRCLAPEGRHHESIANKKLSRSSPPLAQQHFRRPVCLLLKHKRKQTP